MTLTIELTPSEEASLRAVAEKRGVAPAALARVLVTESLVTLTPGAQAEDPTLALFQEWESEDARMTPAEAEHERRLWEQFENGINETRRTLGMRPL